VTKVRLPRMHCIKFYQNIPAAEFGRCNTSRDFKHQRALGAMSNSTPKSENTLDAELFKERVP